MTIRSFPVDALPGVLDASMTIDASMKPFATDLGAAPLACGLIDSFVDCTGAGTASCAATCPTGMSRGACCNPGLDCPMNFEEPCTCGGDGVFHCYFGGVPRDMAPPPYPPDLGCGPSRDVFDCVADPHWCQSMAQCTRLSNGDPSCCNPGLVCQFAQQECTCGADGTFHCACYGAWCDMAGR